MTQDERADEMAALRRETQAIWEQKADHWDAQMGEGNTFHNQLVAPAAARLLAPQAGETILDVACGNGQFSRQLAALGVTVVAADFSTTFLARAATRTTAHAERITYRQLDATDEAALLALGTERFDAAVCNMALMDMPMIAPLLRALRQLLKPEGRFVFAVPHPCFNNNATRLTLEEEDHAGELRETRGVRIAEYLQIPPGKGAGMPGEPVPHYYFHRPLHELLGECFAAGFALDGLEEPSFAPETTSRRALSWAHHRQIPPALVVRIRPVPR